jgi:hypothetical protein
VYCSKYGISLGARLRIDFDNFFKSNEMYE